MPGFWPLTLFREDVITLQNPHGFPTASVNTKPAQTAQAAKDKAAEKSDKSKAVAVKSAAAPAVAKAKAAVPCKHTHVSFPYGKI